MRIVLFVCLFILLAAEACDPGLTQLRQRDTLRLIACTPSVSPDECAVLTGSSEARCSIDLPDNTYVCCGPTELLIQLLSGEIQLSAQDNSLSQTIQPFPVPSSLVFSTPSYPGGPSSTVVGNPYASMTRKKHVALMIQ